MVATLDAEIDRIREPDLVEPRAKWLRDVFTRLSLRRPSSINGPEPIPPSEMLAWCQLTGTSLLPWEVVLLEQMDAALLTSLNRPSQQG